MHRDQLGAIIARGREYFPSSRILARGAAPTALSILLFRSIARSARRTETARFRGPEAPSGSVTSERAPR